jgi:hypothetical protein
MNENIKTASKTIIDMCVNYSMGALPEEVFVQNINNFAKYINAESRTPIVQPDLSDSDSKESTSKSTPRCHSFWHRECENRGRHCHECDEWY